MDRVKWFRDRAHRDHAVEEQETLEAEFARAIAWFGRSSEVWEWIASDADDTESPGWKAYAYKQSGMYHSLAVECADVWKRVPAVVEQDWLDEEEKARLAAIKAAKEAGGSEFTTDYSVRRVAVDGHNGELMARLASRRSTMNWRSDHSASVVPGRVPKRLFPKR